MRQTITDELWQELHARKPEAASLLRSRGVTEVRIVQNTARTAYYFPMDEAALLDDPRGQHFDRVHPDQQQGREVALVLDNEK